MNYFIFAIYRITSLLFLDSSAIELPVLIPFSIVHKIPSLSNMYTLHTCKGDACSLYLFPKCRHCFISSMYVEIIIEKYR